MDAIERRARSAPFAWARRGGSMQQARTPKHRIAVTDVCTVRTFVSTGLCIYIYAEFWCDIVNTPRNRTELPKLDFFLRLKFPYITRTRKRHPLHLSQLRNNLSPSHPLPLVPSVPPRSDYL